jgi:RHS repeat-associated protein
LAIIRGLIVLLVFTLTAFSQRFPEPVSDPYRSWAMEKWGAAIVNDPAKEGTVWGESADPDADGYINLQEYTYDTDPRQPTLDPVSWSGGGMVPGFASLTFRQRVDDPALIIFPQYSEDMQSWWPEPPRESFSWSGDGVLFRKASESAIIGGSRNVTYYCTIPLSTAPRLFTRLMVMRDHVQAIGSPFDSLRFFEGVAASNGSTLDSNSVLLTGFAGRVRVTVTGGARLIVNGVDMGTSAEVAAGSTIRLQAMSPEGSATHTLSIGDFSTTWNVATRSLNALSGTTGTVSGYTPVNASVSETGAANITLPIAVPPGTGGMQPQLAITYSSQGGNGLLGVGFSIAGLSAITRAPPTQYHDGFKGGIALGPNDRFALDGQRLVLAAGTWGGNGSEYRPEQESFSKITSHGNTMAGPQSWTVRMKNGNTFEFGASADSRILANRSSVPGDTAVLAWALTRITDNVGNVIEFSYAAPEGSESGYPRIALITYTKNAAASLAAASEVAFEYEYRPDVRTNYVAGAKVEVRKRLTAIECRNGGKVARRYEFAYQQAEISNNSQLIQVLEKGSKPDNPDDEWATFSPTIFSWHRNPAANMSLITPAQAPALGQMLFSRSPPSLIVEGDFNGDGRMDLMHFDDHGPADIWVASGKSDGTFAFAVATGFIAADANDYSDNTTYSRIRTGDFNGDGKTDVLQMNRSGSRNWVAISRGDGSFDVRHGPQLGALQGVGQSGDFKSEVFTLDINGDGRTDLVLLSAFGNNRVFLGVGDGSFSEVPVPANDPFRNFKISDTDATNTFLVPGDFNGDGLGDILLLYNAGQHRLALSNGDGTFTVRASTELGGINGVQFRRTRAVFVSGDFNGDGLTDLTHFDEDGTAWLSFSKGDGAFETLTHPPSIQGLALESQTGHSRLLAADFNGDGFADVFHAYYSASSRGWLASSKGNTSFAVLLAGQLGVLDGKSYEKIDSTQQTRLFTGDFDGDGTEDLLNLHYPFIGNGTASNFLARSTGFDADRVTQVTNGHGGWTIFSYKPLTDPSVYLKGSGAIYPNVDMIVPMHVVASIRSRNGVDGDAFIAQPSPPKGESVTNYRYEGGWMCLDGRGFRGFTAMVATNLETGITSRTEYELSDLDFSGQPARELLTLSDGRVVSETVNTWAKKEFTFTTTIGGQARTYRRFFPYASQSVTKEFEINNPAGAPPVKTTTVTGVAYDDFGNLTDSTTNHGSGFTEVTHSNFNNNTVKWWLGRLSETTVTQTSPAANGPVSISRQSSFKYSDTTGQLTRETIETDDAKLKLEKTYVHDAFGNITQSSLKDLAANKTRTTKTTYTPDGRFIAETENHLGHLERKEYDPLTGATISQTGPNGLTTSWLRDGFGRPLRELRPDGTETITQYLRSSLGGIFPPRTVHYVLTHSSGGAAVYKFFDLLDREIGTATPHFSGQLIATHQVYNSRGELTHQSQPFITTPAAPTAPASRYTVNEFDVIGRAKKQIAPGSRITSTAYAGLSATVTNPKSQTFTRTSDVRGRITASTSFGTDTVGNVHDPYGNLLRVDDGRGHVTAMNYDARGRKISIIEPNSGTTFYAYNAFDELTEQTDALGRRTQLFYDALGRLIRRIEPDESGYPVETIWEYDTVPHGKGKLARVHRLSDDYEESYRYDTFGRAVETLTRIGAMRFVSGTNVDEYGRPSVVTYPTAFAIKNEYNGDGYLRKVLDAGSSFTYWTAKAFDDRGQLSEELFGNGLITKRVFDPDTGLVQTIQTGTAGGSSFSASVQNLAYKFDPIGNLLERRDVNRGVFENFQYDGANQLAGISGNAADPITIACDRLGNITGRSDVGAYTYGENGTGRHAVTRITDAAGATTRNLRYDAAGNCIQNGDTTLRYTANNQPAEIHKGDATLTFSYTPSRARYRLIERSGGIRTDKLYIGGLYERETNGAGIVHTHFIPAGGSVVAIHTQTQTLDASLITVTTDKTRYVHKDHLGSIHTLTRENGAVEEVLHFDAWGRRRTFDSATHRYTYANVTSQTDRGFTGHEMLDAVGLIHMNGRIYDPTLGRFLSSDPLVEDPGGLQSLNRYAYVLNNPLSATDPSGYFFSGLKKLFKSVAKLFIQHVVGSVFGAIGFVIAGPPGFAAGYGFGSAFSGTLLAGGSVGDALRAGLVGGISARLTFGIGSVFESKSLAPYAALKPIVHGAAQGGIRVAQGGKFTHGFLSGAFASQFSGAANLAEDAAESVWAGRVVAAVVGGTAEVIGGGKFGNGAVTGTFMRMFNDEPHRAELRRRLEISKMSLGHHAFGLETKACSYDESGCTGATIWRALLDNSLPLELATATNLQTGERGALLFLGFVYQQVDPASMTVTNITNDFWHPFAGGYVEQSVQFRADGIYIQVYGEGQNSFIQAWADEKLGPILFRGLGEQIKNNWRNY